MLLPLGEKLNLEAAVKLNQARSKALAVAPVRSEDDSFLMLAYLSTHSLEGLLDSFSQGFEKFHPVSSSVLQGIELRLKDFHQLLLHPPKVWGSSSSSSSSAPFSGPVPAP